MHYYISALYPCSSHGKWEKTLKNRSLLTTSRYIFVNAIEKLEECNNFQLQPSGVTGREQNEKWVHLHLDNDCIPFLHIKN